jgi:hypothetical protein
MPQSLFHLPSHSGLSGWLSVRTSLRAIGKRQARVTGILEPIQLGQEELPSIEITVVFFWSPKADIFGLGIGIGFQENLHGYDFFTFVWNTLRYCVILNSLLDGLLSL